MFSPAKQSAKKVVAFALRRERSAKQSAEKDGFRFCGGNAGLLPCEKFSKYKGLVAQGFSLGSPRDFRSLATYAFSASSKVMHVHANHLYIGMRIPVS
jgi:hypothetical protein